MHTIYYLVNLHTDRRLRWYKTLAGARIAQRQRNSSLGFHHRLERVQVDDREYERCQLETGVIVDATWVIEENWVESPDLLE
jgi:hypothetical protein